MTAVRAVVRLTKPLQIGFLVLLVVSSAQLGWWIIDQIEYTAHVRSQLRAAYQLDARAAQVLLRAGTPWHDIAAIYPHLIVASDSATVRVSREALAALDAERFHRLNRYAWEGAFFLAVLIGAMAVVYRALREEAVLRRRQETFLGAVSHELKSPLTSLKLSVETLALRDPPPPQRSELVGRLLGDLARLERMIGNLLDASRLSAFTARAAPQALVLAQEVASAVREVQAQADDCGVSVTAEIPTKLMVRADRQAMRTVLRNLLDNGIKAACGGGVVALRADAADGRVRLQVRDNGIGFPPEQAPRLFEKFYRVEGEGRERLSGTGLGLYLVRRLVMLDGGTVEATSAGSHQGSVFAVTWPASGGGAA